MGEVDDLEHAEDQRQARRDQGVEQPEHQAVERELDEVEGIDRHAGTIRKIHTSYSANLPRAGWPLEGVMLYQAGLFGGRPG